MSMTQVYNGKWGVGRVTKLFAPDSFLSTRVSQKTCGVLSSGTPDEKLVK